MTHFFLETVNDFISRCTFTQRFKSISGQEFQSRNINVNGTSILNINDDDELVLLKI